MIISDDPRYDNSHHGGRELSASFRKDEEVKEIHRCDTNQKNIEREMKKSSLSDDKNVRL